MKPQKGFTLIEILVVVVIISITSVLWVQLLNSGSVERVLKKHGRTIRVSIEYFCNQSILENTPHGILFFENGYSFYKYTDAQWIEFSNDILNFGKLTDGSRLQLEVEGESVVLNANNEIPQVYCNSSGEITPFKLSVTDSTEKHSYNLETVDFWHIEGSWSDG